MALEVIVKLFPPLSTVDLMLAAFDSRWYNPAVFRFACTTLLRSSLNIHFFLKFGIFPWHLCIPGTGLMILLGNREAAFRSVVAKRSYDENTRRLLALSSQFSTVPDGPEPSCL